MASLDEIRKTLNEGLTSNTLPEFRELTAHFEEFVEIFEQRREALANPQEAPLFLKKLGESQQKVQRSFDKTCLALGMTPAQFREFVENPNHFTPEQWAELEQVKTESNDLVEGSAPKKNKHRRRKHLHSSSKI